MTDDQSTPQEAVADDGDDATTNGDGDSDAIEPSENALPPEKLVYPTFEFEDGEIDADGGFDLSREMDADGMAEWLEDLVGGLGSHDVAVESPDGHVRFGIAPKDVEMSFDPDENHQGELEVTFRFRSKAMFVADDPTKRTVGARGGVGFIPIEMLTTDRETFHCYNWIEEPTDP